eukprot:CAMPEP_0196675650 /NCGR_PEP_ID=MMETSP1090-20130531/4225_1 /TAXON_ID=37098 /ORGANISM="Isochrysis sp, Strain CCMP1244" /LENGTH=148 /DNA_ID=CAMNT_0042013513 /DNA_START=481 /DNA_END=926 /DNA_ORIENTATION=+
MQISASAAQRSAGGGNWLATASQLLAGVGHAVEQASRRPLARRRRGHRAGVRSASQPGSAEAAARLGAPALGAKVNAAPHTLTATLKLTLTRHGCLRLPLRGELRRQPRRAAVERGRRKRFPFTPSALHECGRPLGDGHAVEFSVTKD